MARPKPEWWENAREMRRQGMTYPKMRRVLMDQNFDVNVGSLHNCCKDVTVPNELDPDDWRSIVYPDQTWDPNKKVSRKTVH